MELVLTNAACLRFRPSRLWCSAEDQRMAHTSSNLTSICMMKRPTLVQLFYKSPLEVLYNDACAFALESQKELILHGKMQ